MLSFFFKRFCQFSLSDTSCHTSRTGSISDLKLHVNNYTICNFVLFLFKVPVNTSQCLRRILTRGNIDMTKVLTCTRLMSESHPVLIWVIIVGNTPQLWPLLTSEFCLWANDGSAHMSCFGINMNKGTETQVDFKGHFILTTFMLWVLQLSHIFYLVGSKG